MPYGSCTVSILPLYFYPCPQIMGSVLPIPPRHPATQLATSLYSPSVLTRYNRYLIREAYILCTSHIAVDFDIVLCKGLFRDELGGGGCSKTHVHKITSVHVFYMPLELHDFDRGESITRAIGRDGP
jgi:hypothetical protein